MISLKQFLSQVLFCAEEEILVNKSILTGGHWMTSAPSTNSDKPKLISYDVPQIVIRNARPWTDQAAVHRGEKIVAYIRGDEIQENPIGSSREVIFVPSKLPEPFHYRDDGSKFLGSEFMIFTGHKLFAY